ncbi:GntR family transcriptional regulator [Ureibacillus sp. 179-F W5.1 NHS]|uniref:GntR family transcriptional regulator n=1 Tax=Lysinibacillus halotolerans TaxID=1368476 RepID=A0A3M8HA55_9BACI|nr:GntR family transcriptional regulator [Lysinibacillus halotolerans]RNC99292.1 GntR family transcriptional regulator [Lysinibacillus halotolerans]
MDNIDVRDYLLEKIQNCNCEEGLKLPSENKLAAKFSIPRKRIRDVYLDLEQMGMIESKQGIGHFVKPKRKLLDIVLTGDVSFSEKMKLQTKDYKSVLTRLEQIEMSKLEYPHIEFANCKTLYIIERLRFVDGEPAAIHRSYVNADLFPEIKKERSQLSSIYQFYKTHGIENFESSFTRLSTIFPGKYERMMLHCENLVPIILVESDNWNKDENVQLEYTEILYRSDRFSFQLTNTRKEKGCLC